MAAKFSHIVLFIVFTSISAFCQNDDFSVLNSVDPFIGTGGHGHTYPGAVSPFGMIQLSPDTDMKGWDWCSGYHYSDSSLMGFSHTHLSGTGWSDLGDILLMPTVGDIKINPGSKENPDSGYRSRFTHQEETASPGYYQVYLQDYKINVELTASDRVGFHRYTYPESEFSNIIIDPTHKIFGSTIKTQIAIEGNTVSGYCFSKGWGGDRYVYFVAEFSKPIARYGIYNGSRKINDTNFAEGDSVKAFVQFNTGSGEQLTVKVAISAVSLDGAKLNLLEEGTGKSFDQVLYDAKNKWNYELSKIKIVSDNEEQKKIFYTALYHNFIQPSLSMDVDGKYSAAGKINKAEGFINYSSFSLWDTFRATHPLLTILDTKRTTDSVNSLITRHRDSNGRLPMWELCGYDNKCMIAAHSTSVIWDAISKNIEGIDINAAFDAMWDISHYSKSSSSSENNHLSYNPEYFEKGFMTAEKAESSVSNTIELGYNDWCVQQLALRLGEKEKAGQLEFRINGYKNLWNEKEKQFWPKDYNNEWLKNVKIDDWETLKPHYISGNIWAYKFGVLHNIDGMIELMGGKQKFEESLDELFTREIEMSGEAYVDISGFIGLYGHGDEPGHHIPYLYNYTSSPWKTQRIVNRIRNEFYHANPDGYVNNEDCGQMSAWYVFSALGFYPACPGKPTYEIGSPLFEYAIIELENGKQFKVIAHNVSDSNVYVKSVKLNGNPITKWQINHSDIMKGGTLEFEMYDRINDNGKTEGSL